jgi:hypothetical protein
MKAKFGAIIVDGRGKVGGHVVSKNRAGSYIRTKVTPANPNTSYQAEARNRLSNLSTAWGALDAAERLAWNNAVEHYKKTDIFGDLKNPAGFNLFQRINNNLAQIGVAQIDTPALPAEMPVIISGVLTATHASTIEVTFDTDPVFTACDMAVDATPALTPGKSYVKSEFRRIGKYSAVDAHVLDLSDEYDDKFGAVGAAGQNVFIRMKMINKTTGQAGIPVVLSVAID